MGILAAIYVVAAKFGLSLNAVSGFATVVWAPTGIALAALLIFGHSLWPGVFVGAFVSNVLAGASPLVAAGIAAGNTLEAVAGTYLLHRFAFQPAMVRLKDVVALVGLASVVSTAISATIGVASLFFGGQLALVAIGKTWGAWWYGDAIGDLLFAPFLLVWCTGRWRRPGVSRSLEALFLGVLLIATAVITFGPTVAAYLGTTFVPRYFLFPFFVWSALRFGPRGVMMASMVTAIVAVCETAFGSGSAIGTTALQNLVFTQSFVGVAAITAMVLAAIVAERQDAIVRLEEGEDRLRLAVEASKIGTWDWDLVSDCMVWSARLRQVLGVSAESEVNYEKFIACVHPDDRERINLSIQRSHQQVGLGFYNIEYRVLGSGKRRWVSAKGQTFFNDRNLPVRMVGTVLDITDQRDMQDDLLSAKEVADGANQAKRTFLAHMSHEIRAPISVIIGFSELLREQSLAESERHVFLETISRNGESALAIINDILDLSKVEANKLELAPTDFDVALLIHDVVNSMQIKSAEKGVALHKHLHRDVPRFAKADAQRLRQILVNLLANAIKFTDAGSIMLTVSASPYSSHGPAASQTRREDICLEFAVTDTGCGIDVDHQEKLFKSFSQADAQVSGKFGGTGLGLSLSKDLARIMGGDLRLHWSEAGKGSTFVATICCEAALTPPASIVAGATTKAAACRPSDLGESAGAGSIASVLDGRTILLVEDSEDSQILTKTFLKRSGAQVEIAGNGVEGLAKAKATPFDFILMDMEMPKLGGVAATIALRQSGYTGPIVALTAHAMSEERERCRAAGFSDFISKPFERRQLIETLLRCGLDWEESLPDRALAHDLASDVASNTILPGMAGKQRLHICIVDDEPELGRLYLQQFRRLIENGSCKVSCVRSGRACLELLRGGSKVDVAITDLNMPEMDGYELLEIIRRDFPWIKALVCSAYGDSAHIQRALGAGARKYFRKPLPMRDVEAELFAVQNAEG